MANIKAKKHGEWIPQDEEVKTYIITSYNDDVGETFSYRFRGTEEEVKKHLLKLVMLDRSAHIPEGEGEDNIVSDITDTLNSIGWGTGYYSHSIRSLIAYVKYYMDYSVFQATPEEEPLSANDDIRLALQFKKAVPYAN